MTRSEGGYTLIELSVAVCLIALIALATNTFVFHTFAISDKDRDRLTAISNAENAGYSISRDASMADVVITDNLTAPAILVLKWTDWGYAQANVYYSATYSVENIAGGIGQLTRRLQDSRGTDRKITVANYVYYNVSDPLNTTSVSYQTPVISLNVATRSGNDSEFRSYQVYRRPNF